MGALSVTTNPKYQKPFAPLLPGIDVGKVNDTAALSGLITEDTCAVIVEPIQGEGGINSAKVEWLQALRKRCDDVGAVLIYDEIQVSFSPSFCHNETLMFPSAGCTGRDRCGHIQCFLLIVILM